MGTGTPNPCLWAVRKVPSLLLTCPRPPSRPWPRCGDTAGQTLLWGWPHALRLYVTGPFSPALAPRQGHNPPLSPACKASSLATSPCAGPSAQVPMRRRCHVGLGQGPLSRLWAHGSPCSSALARHQRDWSALPRLPAPLPVPQPSSTCCSPLNSALPCLSQPQLTWRMGPGLLTPSLASLPVNQVDLQRCPLPIGPGDCPRLRPVPFLLLLGEG